jgi:ribosomal protein S18 acetylase RimI-like enzyme
MILLREFQQSDARDISGWPLSETDLLFWAHIEDVRADLQQIINSWQGDPDVCAFTLEQDSEIVGYGELWVEDKEVELARLLVKPNHRSQGLGKALLLQLLEKALPLKRKIWLRVHPNNRHARDIYIRNGFSVAANDLQIEFNQHQPIKFIWMQGPCH